MFCVHVGTAAAQHGERTLVAGALRAVSFPLARVF